MGIMKTLHVELTTRCTLECPACPRTTWREIVKRPIQKSDLDIDDFAQFINCNSGQDFDRLLLCGDYGDCIYHPEFFEFIKRFRYKKFNINTNGSHRPAEFWHSLAELMQQDDVIVFGIDGLEDTNHLYRKNSNWSSIMTAVDIMSKSKARIEWQTIIFSFNYDRLNEIKQFAESKGAYFFALKTHRFGDDSLVPPDTQFIEIHKLWQDDFIKNDPIKIDPQCSSSCVVTADGYFLPCDWIRNPKTFYKSDLWIKKKEWYDQLSIKAINLDQAIEMLKKWETLVIKKGLEGDPRLDHLCKMTCREGCNQSNRVEI